MSENKNIEYAAKRKYAGDVATQYNEKRISDSLWEREQKAFKEYLDSLPQGSSIIDIPIGTGRFIEFYKELGLDARGVDISEDMLAEARKNANRLKFEMEFILGDALDLPQDESECDYIICARLLNWVPFDILESMLKEFIRVSKKGMILQIRVGTPLTSKEYFGNLAYRLTNKPLTVLKPTLRRLFMGKPVDFYIHDNDAVEELFLKYGQKIVDRKVVDKAIKLGPRVFSRSTIFLLEPTTTPDQHD